MPRRTKEEAAQTRRTILHAAEDVFFKKGVSHASLQEIAESAGVTRGAVYWHFRDKSDLLQALADETFLPQEQIMENLVASDTATPLVDLQKSCLGALRDVLRNPRSRRILNILTNRCEYVEDMAPITHRNIECRIRMTDRFVVLFERAHKLKQLSPNYTPQTAAHLLHWLLIGFFTSDVEEPYSAVREKQGMDCVIAFFKTASA